MQQWERVPNVAFFLFIQVFAPDYFLRVMGWRERSLMSPLR